MPKYKNVSKFSKVLQIGSKRILIKSQETVFLEQEVNTTIYDYLQEVDEKSQASVPKEIVQQKISAVSQEEVRKVQASVIKVHEEIEQIKTDTTKATDEKLSLMSDQIEKALKRLEVLKSAVETIHKTQQELIDVVTGLQEDVYEKGAIVIEGLDDEPNKQHEGKH